MPARRCAWRPSGSYATASAKTEWPQPWRRAIQLLRLLPQEAKDRLLRLPLAAGGVLRSNGGGAGPRQVVVVELAPVLAFRLDCFFQGPDFDHSVSDRAGCL